MRPATVKRTAACKTCGPLFDQFAAMADIVQGPLQKRRERYFSDSLTAIAAIAPVNARPCQREAGRKASPYCGAALPSCSRSHAFRYLAALASVAFQRGADPASASDARPSASMRSILAMFA